MNTGYHDFCHALIEEEKSKGTIEKYSREAKRLVAFLAGNAPDKARLLAYRELLRQKYQTQTVNGKLSAINAYLRFIGREDCCVRLLNVQRRAFIDRSRELTHADYVRLLGAAQDKRFERIRLVMLTLCSAGMRVSELKYITVEAMRAGRAEIALKGKTRVILLPKALRGKLADYIKRKGIASGCIFRTRSGKPLNRSNIWRDMKRAAVRAHVCASRVFPHNLRHLFARSYYAMEKDLAHLADILGHSSVETTRIYVASSEREHEHTLMRMRLVI